MITLVKIFLRDFFKAPQNFPSILAYGEIRGKLCFSEIPPQKLMRKNFFIHLKYIREIVVRQ